MWWDFMRSLAIARDMNVFAFPLSTHHENLNAVIISTASGAARIIPSPATGLETPRCLERAIADARDENVPKRVSEKLAA